MSDLTKFILEAQSTSRRIVESGDQHIPVALVLTPSHVLVIGFSGSDKDAWVAALRTVLQEQHALAYIHITEAWMTSSERAIKNEMEVHDLPPDDRDDAIVMLVKERGATPLMYTAIIDDTPQGRRLREFRFFDGDSLTGRFILDW